MLGRPVRGLVALVVARHGVAADDEELQLGQRREVADGAWALPGLDLARAFDREDPERVPHRAGGEDVADLAGRDGEPLGDEVEVLWVEIDKAVGEVAEALEPRAAIDRGLEVGGLELDVEQVQPFEGAKHGHGEGGLVWTRRFRADEPARMGHNEVRNAGREAEERRDLSNGSFASRPAALNPQTLELELVGQLCVSPKNERSELMVKPAGAVQDVKGGRVESKGNDKSGGIPAEPHTVDGVVHIRWLWTRDWGVGPSKRRHAPCKWDQEAVPGGLDHVPISHGEGHLVCLHAQIQDDGLNLGGEVGAHDHAADKSQQGTEVGTAPPCGHSNLETVEEDWLGEASALARCQRKVAQRQSALAGDRVEAECQFASRVGLTTLGAEVFETHELYLHGQREEVPKCSQLRKPAREVSSPGKSGTSLGGSVRQGRVRVVVGLVHCGRG